MPASMRLVRARRESSRFTSSAASVQGNVPLSASPGYSPTFAAGGVARIAVGVIAIAVICGLE
jgi:hypothetical protein